MSKRAATMLVSGLLVGIASLAPSAQAGTWSSLDVEGETVRVFRDDFGRPSIFAESNRGLFTATGYVAAEDRLWQIDLNRRVSRGRLAEAFGPGSVLSDTFIRTTGYTDAELDALLAALPASEQEVYASYAAGINRYLGEARANPFGKLPFEFHAVGLGVPADYTAQDIAAVVVFLVRRFAEVGGHELQNKQLLDALVARHGAVQGYAIFDDLRWINDPEAPASIPEEGAFGKRQHPSRPPNAKQLEPFGGLGVDTEALRKHWEELGIPTRLGSFGWVVSPKKSAEGYAMLYGGPQLGALAAPEIVHEVQLKSGEGVNVRGITIPGVPWVFIGRNDHVAWTLTAGLAGDNIDIYLEELCDVGAGFGSGYVFNGACRPYSARMEIITVRGAPSRTITVLRSVHGPVVAQFGAFTATQKRALWMTELQAANAVAKIDRARNLPEFEAAVHEFTGALNFLYADKRGNIGYWLSGPNPLRAPDFDPRLPLPGDGSAEWTGGYRPIPSSINPTRGWLASWNNKPTADYEDGDGGNIFGSQPFGAMHRYNDLAANFERLNVSLDNMRDIPKDIARVNVVNRNGREARFLVPYLLAALDAFPPSHPVAAEARAVLESWDGSMFADPVTSTTMLPGQVIFATWLSRAMFNTFNDELGSLLPETTGGVLLHALDHALRPGGSPVPPNLDYFNGENPHLVLSQSFDEAVAGLSSATVPRGFIEIRHTLLGTLAKVPLANRATYAQIVQLKSPTIEAENILPLGQSGMIRLTPTGAPSFDPHFFDQLGTFTQFGYKPMPLYKNTQLHE